MASFLQTVCAALRGADRTVRHTRFFQFAEANARPPRKARLTLEALETRELLSAAAVIGPALPVVQSSSKIAIITSQPAVAKSPTAAALAAPAATISASVAPCLPNAMLAPMVSRNKYTSCPT